MDNNGNRNYAKYLCSAEWTDKAKQRMRIDGYQCQFCGCRGTTLNPLECHHLTYKNIYHENPYADLVTVCRSCHKGTHRLMQRITDEHGKRGFSNTYVPDVHCYDLGGKISYVLDSDGDGV